MQRYITNEKGCAIRLADPTNTSFQPLHQALNNRFRELHSHCVGNSRKQAEIITRDEEEQLQQMGVLSSESTLGLLRAVSYLNGLNFVLRGGDEHRKLKISQFAYSEVANPDNPREMIHYEQYTEHGSKNHPGGSHQLNENNKVVTQFVKPELGDKCHVFLLELHLSKLPNSVFQGDVFYMKLKPCVPDSPADPWYMNIAIGHNTLSSMLKEIAKAESLDVTDKSNHSLRSTAISWMYEGRVPEKLIMEKSGHLSANGMHPYERTSLAQQQTVCDTISSVPLMAAKMGNKGKGLPKVYQDDINTVESDVK